MTRVSVVTPCFNADKFIGACVESVAKSITLGEIDVEHVVVDDGSTDGSKNELLNMSIPGLKVILLNENNGQSKARNIGWKNSTGEYVFFLDADDVVFANSLRLLVGVAEKKKSEWVYGDFVRGDENLKYLVGEDYYGWTFNNAKEALTSMYTGKHFFQQSSLFKKTAIEEVGGFDESMKMAEDFELCTRLLLKEYCPIYVPSALYMHRYHQNNLSRAHLKDRDLYKKDIRRLFEKYHSQLEKILSSQEIVGILDSLGIERAESGRRVGRES